MKAGSVNSEFSKVADLSDAERESMLRGLRNLQRGVGEIALLLMAHPAYKGLFLGDLLQVAMPPVLYNQYQVFRNKNDRTIGYVSWALVSESVHKRLMSGQLKLQTKEWAEGSLVVVMDVVAFGTEAGTRMLQEVKQGIFMEQDLWVLRTDAGAREPKLALYELPIRSEKDA